ncbi:MAG: hypothetical protein OEU95_06120 [Nitrospirota bacterium]|nr:hypothetical protein [Nitrospirota bacterium]
MNGLSPTELFMVFALFVPLALLVTGITLLFLYAGFLLARDWFLKMFNSAHLRHGKAH